MTDNDKDKMTANTADGTASGNVEAENEVSETGTFAQTSLRDLVLSAEAALSDLGSSVLEDAPMKNARENVENEEVAEAEMAPETSSKKTAKKKGSSKKRKAEASSDEGTAEESLSESVSESISQAAAAIAWSEEVAGLEFAENVEDATDEVSPLEALAKRVAESAAQKEEGQNEEVIASEEEVMESVEIEASSVEQTPAEQMPAEQMELGAFEEQLDAAEDDADTEPQEFIEQDQLLSIIESLLFATDRPVSVASIKQIFKGSNIRSKDITRALDSLASEYAAASRGVTLEEVHGGYQLRTKSDNAEFLRRLVKARPFRLSGPALEVMSIVAYKQPITKHQIDEIRGVESGHLLRALMERGLVSFGEKSDLPGKPMTYETTRKFLEIFGLRNIRELPTLREIDELLPDGIGEEEEKETLSDLTDKMSTELTSTYSEGEEELNKISEQLKAVDTTTEFFEQEKQRERERRDREKAQDIRERLVLGDQVEDKDRRWLDRYEAKLAAPPAESTETEALAANDEVVSIAAEIEELSEESQLNAFASETESDSDLTEELSEDLSEDLTAHQDWDEDSEKEA